MRIIKVGPCVWGGVKGILKGWVMIRKGGFPERQGSPRGNGDQFRGDGGDCSPGFPAQGDESDRDVSF